jgi:reactive intermediate/imine deaminase
MLMMIRSATPFRVDMPSSRRDQATRSRLARRTVNDRDHSRGDRHAGTAFTRAAWLLAGVQPALADGSKSVEFLNSGKVVPTTLPFSEGVRVGHTLYLSGQVGIKPGTLELVPGGIKEEARQTLENIRASLEANGYSMREVVKCTVMLADIAEWATFNEVYRTFFSAPLPARSALGQNRLAMGARVEVECMRRTRRLTANCWFCGSPSAMS